MKPLPVPCSLSVVMPVFNEAATIGPVLAAVLAKHFADRQVDVAPEVIAYLVKQIERSFVAAETMARRLDRAAMARRAPITIRLARDLLSGEDS